MRFLRTNTATRITVGPFFDVTDGVTPETGLTVTSIKLTLVVDTAGVPTLVLDTNPTASGGSNDMVHITGDDAGFYDLELAAANVNYFGRAVLALTDATNHRPVYHEFMILPANIYDAFILGTDLIDVNMDEVDGDATAAANAKRTLIAVVTCTVGSGSTTTDIVTSACAPSGAALDQFKGRIVIFDKDTTTAALRGQASDITDSTNSATPVLTVTALSTAPVSGDTFTIT